MLIELSETIAQMVQSIYTSKAGMKLLEVIDIEAMFDYIADNLVPILRGKTTSAMVAHEIVSEDVIENVLSASDVREGQVLFECVQILIAEMVQFLEFFVEDIHNVDYAISIAKLWPSGRVVLLLTTGSD